MSAAILLNATCEREHIVRLFSRFANRYGASWTNRLGTMSNWDDCIDDWYSDLKTYDYKALVNAAKSALILFPKFPPTFAEFDELCRKFSGFPQVEEVITLMTARDFNHPIVKMVYDKIGSWQLSNGKEADIRAKAKSAYEESVAEFSIDPAKEWTKLESYNNRPKELPAPDKIPNAEERKNFKGLKEMLVEHRQAADKAKKETGFTFPEFDEKEIQEGSPGYDSYCRYLLSIPDHMVLNIPPKHAYRRQRLLNRAKTAEHLRESGYVRPEYREPFVDPRKTNGKPNVIYKDWRDK